MRRMPARTRAIAAGLHRQIAFGVHAHRSREKLADPIAHELVVDDHHLRVDEGRHVLRARRRRIDEPQPLVRVGGDQRPEDAVTEGAHRVLFEPAVAFLRRDDHDLGAVRLLQSRGQRSASVSLVKYWLSM